MALLSDGMKDKEFDVRMTARKLSKGLMLQEELEKYEKKLPDDSSNADYMNLEAAFDSVKGKAGLRF